MREESAEPPHRGGTCGTVGVPAVPRDATVHGLHPRVSPSRVLVPVPLFITRYTSVFSTESATPMSDTITVHADSGHAERTPNPVHEIVWGATDALGGTRR